MADRSQQLHPVRRVAQQKEDRAARDFSEKQQQFDELRDGLRQLSTFREEYGNRFIADGAGGMNARRVRDYIAFMGNIDQNVVRQQRQVDLARYEVELRRKTLMQTMSRRKAIDSLIAADQVERMQQQDRQEQKDSDERSLQQAVRAVNEGHES